MWDEVLKKAKDKVLGTKPSIVGNLVNGNPWNLNLKRFGGVQSPLQTNIPLAKPIKPAAPKPIQERPSLNFADKKQAKQIVSGLTFAPKPTITPTPKVLGTSIAPTPTSSPTPPLDDLERRTIQTFDNHKIPRSVAYGMAQAEGGVIGNNNKWNINAVDSNPNLATDFPSVEAAATSAAKLMQSMIVKKGAINKKPDEQLKAIEDAGYAGDPKTWKQRSASTGGAGKYYNSWGEFVKNTPAYRKWIN
jgi:hypothetical protein